MALVDREDGFAFEIALAQGLQCADRITPARLETDLWCQSGGRDFGRQVAKICAERRRLARFVYEEGIQHGMRCRHDAAERHGCLLPRRVAEHHYLPVASDQPQRLRQRLATDGLED